MYVTVKSRLKAWVAINELLHFLSISCQYYDQLVAVVFHAFEQGCDGLVAVVVATALHESISFIYKEDATEGLVDELVGLGGGLTDVFSYEARAVRFNQVPLVKYPEGLVNFCEDSRHGGFSCTCIASEDTVVAKRCVLHASIFALLGDFGEFGNFPYFLLDVFHADEFIKFL